MHVYNSNRVEDIIEVSKRSVNAKDGIRIIELSSLSDLIPKEVAETIREQLLGRGVRVKQLTNQVSFDAWTDVSGFVKKCLEVRHVSVGVLPIAAEVLIFDDIVAIYQVEPEVSVCIIEHLAFAREQEALFDHIWQGGMPVSLNDDGSGNSQ